MIGSKMYIVSKKEVEQVTWEGSGLIYDTALYNLGKGKDEFIVVNPDINFYKNFDSLLNYDCSVVLKCQGVWIVKYFKKNWIDTNRFLTIDLDLDLDLNWQRNPDIDINIPFDQPVVKDLYDLNYDMTWYLDPKFSNGDKIWIMRCHLKNSELLGEKTWEILLPTFIFG
jgi:hypothetical protein